MREFDLNEDEKLALQSFIFKQMFYQVLLRDIQNELSSYIEKIKERYKDLGKIIDIDIERGKIIYTERDDN